MATTPPFPPPDSEAVQNYVLALGRGSAAPACGAERHFLKVLAGNARWASRGEQLWVEYWNAHAGDPAFRPNKTTSDRRPKVPNQPVSLVDLAVVAANVGLNITSIEQVAANPLLARAIEMTTNHSLAYFADHPERLLGAINTAKGKYFELLVEEKLNAGATFSDISVTVDQKAALADSMNQPGWDIAITDNHQHIVDVVQLKATDSVSYVKHALERYPDIKIITTSEAAHGGVNHDMVIDSGISNHDIEQVVGHALHDQSGDFLGNFVDCFNPLFPLIFIVATQGYKVSIGKATVEKAFEHASTRAKHSLTGGAIGALFFAMGFGWFSVVPAFLGAKAGPEGIFGLLEGTYDGIVDWYGKRISDAKARLPEECVQLAAWLNDQARAEGIDAVFTPDDVQRALGTRRWGVDCVDHFRDGAVVYLLYKRHPAVAKHHKEMIERDEAALKKYLLAQYDKKTSDSRNDIDEPRKGPVFWLEMYRQPDET
jgi:hypothetical protein